MYTSFCYISCTGVYATANLVRETATISLGCRLVTQPRIESVEEIVKSILRECGRPCESGEILRLAKERWPSEVFDARLVRSALSRLLAKGEVEKLVDYEKGKFLFVLKGES